MVKISFASKWKRAFLIVIASFLTFGAPYVILVVNMVILKRGYFYRTFPVGHSRGSVTPDSLLNLVVFFLIIFGIVIFYEVLKAKESEKTGKG